MKAIKIDLGEGGNPELSVLVQNKLFELGYRWGEYSDTKPINIHARFLYASYDIGYGNDYNYFKKNKNRQIDIKTLLEMESAEDEEKVTKEAKSISPISCKVTTNNQKLIDFLYEKAEKKCIEFDSGPIMENIGVAIVLDKDRRTSYTGTYLTSFWTKNSHVDEICKEVLVEEFLANLERMPDQKQLIKINLNSVYKAEYPVDGKIKVGCQLFDLSTIKNLVAKCEKYNQKAK